MNDDSMVLYSVEAGVATLTFNRSDKLNALTPTMLDLFFSRVTKAAAAAMAR